MKAAGINGEICSSLCPTCILCGNKGEYRYIALHDRLYGTPGDWNIRQCSNPNCRLAWLDPMPCKEHIGKAYQNYYTHQRIIKKINPLRKAYNYVRDGYISRRYGLPGITSRWQKLAGLLLYLRPLNRDNADLMVMQTKPRPGRLLDVGCGSGELLAFLNSIGWQGVGVDPDPAAVQQACAMGLMVHQGSIEEQNYADNHFDLITLSHVIEHIHDPIALFKECYRIIKPGGQIVVLTPNLNSLGHRIFGDAWRGLEPPRHLYLYSAKTLSLTLGRANFTINSVRHPIRGATYMYLESKAIKTGIRAATIKEKLRSRLFACHEWALVKFRPDSGEELFITARK